MVEQVEERRGLDPSSLPPDVLDSEQPLLLRGLVSAWPVVEAARSSDRALVDYLRGFDKELPIVFFTAPPEARGRFFYNKDMTGFNFTRHRGRFGDILERILQAPGVDDPSIYIGSTMLDAYLPGFRGQNPLDIGEPPQMLANIWVGNRTRVAAHNDLPRNLACVVSGRRRFTLFPPDQLANLYVGPLDFNPAGQPISMVDFHAPDFARYPGFKDAMEHATVAELEPGDVLYIPSMWWHHVESLESLNVLVNYWWRSEPVYMGTPMNALKLSLLTIRDLPDDQRRIWMEMFRHYVFESGEVTHAHIPESARSVLAPLDETRARALRAHLLQNLK